jgi:hypothetical protein
VYAALSSIYSIPLNQMVDRNLLLEGSLMGSWCVFGFAPSEWWHMPEPAMAKAHLEQFQKKRDEVNSNNTYEPSGMDDIVDPEPHPDPAPNPEIEAAMEETEMHVLDQLLAGQDPDEFINGGG